jgi:hypothetical protein
VLFIGAVGLLGWIALGGSLDACASHVGSLLVLPAVLKLLNGVRVL